jgi:hypothetical protein
VAICQSENTPTFSSPPSAKTVNALLSFSASSAGVRLCFLKNDDIANEGLPDACAEP